MQRGLVGQPQEETEQNGGWGVSFLGLVAPGVSFLGLVAFKVGGDSGQRRLSFLLEVWAWRDEV